MNYSKYKNNLFIFFILVILSILYLPKRERLLAERVGFEPTVPIRVHTLSKRAL